MDDGKRLKNYHLLCNEIYTMVGTILTVKQLFWSDPRITLYKVGLGSFTCIFHISKPLM